MRQFNELKRSGETIIKRGDPTIQLTEKEIEATDKKRKYVSTAEERKRVKFERLSKGQTKTSKAVKVEILDKNTKFSK